MEGKKNNGIKAVWFIILAAAVLVGLWQIGILEKGTIIQSDKYQAVFLTNNQVYFGRLSNSSSQFPILREIYYLQISQGIQPKEKDAPASANTNINLVKLGSEIHGPQDEMVLNRDHILFYEDLRDDSEVVKAIKQTKK